MTWKNIKKSVPKNYERCLIWMRNGQVSVGTYIPQTNNFNIGRNMILPISEVLYYISQYTAMDEQREV